MSTGVRILHFRAENVKRLECVEFEPDRLVNVISGSNGEGKSSVLDSILYALGGKKALPSEPVRRGAEKAEITLDLGDFKVKRKITQEGRDYLTIESRDGLRFQSPQKMLDGLMAQIAFDPADWLRKSSKDQRAELLAIAPLNVNYDANRAEHKQKYAERRDIGRDVKRLEGVVTSFGELEPLPADLRSLDDVWADHEKVQNHINEHSMHKAAVNGTRGVIEKAQEDLSEFKAKVEAELMKRREAIGRAKEELAAKEKSLEEFGEPKDLGPIKEEFNRTRDAVKLKEKHDQLDKSLADRKKVKDTYDGLTKKIEDLDDELTMALQQAQMPVEGLSVGEDEVLFSGLPLAQASQAEQLRVSLAIATAVQEQKEGQKLSIVRIMDGSLLDDNSMRLVNEFAEEHDIQLWIERIEREGATIVIEGGNIQVEAAEENAPEEVGRTEDDA